MSEMWNLWHGCHKKSEDCQHCYVFRRDKEFEKDSNVVTKTVSFNLPVRRDRSGNWKVPSGTLMWTCFTSDFFIEDSDEWREEAWMMILISLVLSFYGQVLHGFVHCHVILLIRFTKIVPTYFLHIT